MNRESTEVKLEDIPVIDLKSYMESGDQSQCQTVAECFHKYGILIIRDPRVDMKDNDEYIDLMEEYFEKKGQSFYAGEQLKDQKPEYHYLVGVTTEKKEKARRHEKKMQELTEENKPVSPIDPVYDAKWRFYWKIGERPQEATDNFPQVVPEDFPGWDEKMDKWGYKLHSAVFTVAEMAAIGMGVEKDTFVNCLDGGAHLLAPTGSDLEKNGKGAIFAGFHYDISFLTIHGKSRFPGLFVWLRNNQRIQVKVPDGCLLLQAGITFEHMTGGYVHAGFHEVVSTDATVAAFEKAKQAGKRTWRVSSTLFANFRYNVECYPLESLSHLYTEDAAKKYPKRTAFDILMTEMAATSMINGSYESEVKYE